jgi:regulator of nucleoside diphosphate kinase
LIPEKGGLIMKRIISALDKERLGALIRRRVMRYGVRSQDLTGLQDILESADIVAVVPDGTVTLDSFAVLRDVLSGRQRIYSPVIPALADYRNYRISVLAPLGMALLGRTLGDSFEVMTPGGIRAFTVEKVISRLEREDERTSAIEMTRTGTFAGAR